MTFAMLARPPIPCDGHEGNAWALGLIGRLHCPDRKIVHVKGEQCNLRDGSHAAVSLPQTAQG